MRALFATAELASLVKVGGLGDFSSGFAREIRATGVDLDIALPDYGPFELESLTEHELDLPEWCSPATARTVTFEGAPLTLLSVPHIVRPNPYVDSEGESWSDNDQRFIGFSAAVAAWARRTNPDVLHLNDWHVAATLAFLDDPPPAIVTIHNLAYQGISEERWLTRLPNQRTSYEVLGETNLLAGGISLADRVVAVSPTMVRETLPPNKGFGLAKLLASKGNAYGGILNGIDTDDWDPMTDPHLPHNYGPASVETKETIKRELAAEVGLELGAGPLVGMVTRLTEQKGVDIGLGSLDSLFARGGVMLLLGSGERRLADAARKMEARQPGRFVFRDGYDERLSHRIFAASDLYLMPSRFEPAGLTQMQAMRYGAIPVVTGVGGLRDTVVDADSDPAEGNGFVAPKVSVRAVRKALARAISAWAEPARRVAIVKKGMEADWSWRKPALAYLDLYNEITSAR